MRTQFIVESILIGVVSALLTVSVYSHKNQPIKPERNPKLGIVDETAHIS